MLWPSTRVLARARLRMCVYQMLPFDQTPDPSFRCNSLCPKAATCTAQTLAVPRTVEGRLFEPPIPGLLAEGGHPQATPGMYSISPGPRRVREDIRQTS